MDGLNAERLQRSIAVTARLMMGRDVNLTHRGAKAFVTWDKNYHVSRINLPVIPNDASPRLISALQGYLDHEVGHVFNTDPELYGTHEARAKSEGLNTKIAGFLTNVVEDTQIERHIRKEFPGARYNLDAVLKVVLQDIVQPSLDKAKDDQEKRSIALMPFIRARAGDVPAQEFMDRNALWPLFNTFDRAMPDLENRLRAIRRSDQSVDLAIDLMKAIAEELKPPSDEGDDEEESKEKSRKKSKKGKADKDGDEESEAEKSKSDKGDKEDEDGDDGDGDEGDEGDGEGDDGEGEGKSPGDGDTIEVLINGECGMDFDSAAEKAIEKMVIGAMSSDPVRDFTKDFDYIKPAEVLEKANPAPLQEAIDKTAAPMMKDIQRLIAARSLAVRTPGFRTGRLHPASLHRSMMGDDRVFSRKQETRTKDVAVSLVVDLSGSMAGSKVKTAIESAWAFSEVLSRLKIANEVIGFTTSSDTFSKMRADPVLMKEYNEFCASTSSRARLEPVYMPIFKAFDENFGVLQKKRLASAIQGHTGILQNNLDGHSLRYAALRILPRKEPRKIMIVFSDGVPAASVAGDLNKDLRDTVKSLSKSGLEMVGVGIQDESVKKFYPRYVVIHRVEDLVGTVMGKLRELLAPT